MSSDIAIPEKRGNCKLKFIHFKFSVTDLGPSCTEQNCDQALIFYCDVKPIMHKMGWFSNTCNDDCDQYNSVSIIISIILLLSSSVVNKMKSWEWRENNDKRQ